MSILTVTQVNRIVALKLRDTPQFKNVFVQGEISNFKHHYSGHMYFDLKDEKSKIRCVMFKGNNFRLKFVPENGMSVICCGSVDVFERDGTYQVYVTDMQPNGLGSLNLAYEQLKAKLEHEGLFDVSHKKMIPAYPKKIGVATSNTGAAVEDIKKTLAKRWPLCEVVIVPTLVQGALAPADIVASVQFLDQLDGIDTIIVGRGGGSLEDLWAFNTEEVARAVYHCRTPIISGVGHETDFTICDFVADMRAETPTAAAVRATPDQEEVKAHLRQLTQSLDICLTRKIETEENRLDRIKHHSVISDSAAFFRSFSDKIEAYQSKITQCFTLLVSNKENDLKGSAYALNALSPLAVLSRGYSINRINDRVIRSVDDIAVSDRIEMILNDGTAVAEITEVIKNER